MNNGVYTIDMWVCLDETGPVSAGKDSEWLECHKQTCKIKDEVLNGLEEGEDAMTDKEGDGVEGEGEAGTGDWIQETNLLQEKGKNMKQHTCRSSIGAVTA